MFKPLTLAIAMRYLLARKTHKFASFVALISTIGIALGVSALIIVTSVMQGLQDRLKDNLLGTTAHLIVSSDSSLDAATLTSLPHIIAITPYVKGQALLQSDNGIVLVNVEGEDTSKLDFNLKKLDALNDDIPSGSFEIYADMGLLMKLNLNLNDKVRLISTQNARYTPLGLTPSQRIFYIKGALPSLMGNNDVPTVKGNYSDIKKLLRINNKKASYRLYLSDPFLINETTAKLPQSLTYTTWQDSKGDFFKAVAMEKLTMTLMLFLVIIVAAFNILSALAMMVSSRLSEIAVLKTLGMKEKSILLIFIMTGSGCGILGTLIGLLLGIPLTQNITKITEFLKISVSANATELPAVISPMNITLIVAGALFLSLLCTLYPAYKAAKTDPIRHLQQGF